jgi:uncharacterized protein
MNLFFDSSALLKRYLNEKGTSEVRKLFDDADKIFVSVASSFQRLLHTQFIDKKKYEQLTLEINIDFPLFEVVPFDEDIKHTALVVLEKHPMKALDTIQLASLIHTKNEIESFVVCDHKLEINAQKEGFHIIDPTE